MQLFTEYLHPLTQWLQTHPHWALFITFLISFAESLAIIGSIVPGSITMTAIGILAGSGVMRFDLTLLAASLGAIAGDSGSYALGMIYSEQLSNIWPFCRYPSWITFGKDYFHRHGSISVFIGRFVGPMRSIIPVIAGMLHMNQWHFLSANILSAFLWSLLYITPGYLIGEVSSELSPESASRLFTWILILLGAIWLCTCIIKWLLKHFKQWSRANLHMAWSFLKKHPHLGAFAKKLVPADEINHYPTALFVVLACFTAISSILVIFVVLQQDWALTINGPIYHFLQTIQIKSLEKLSFIISLITSFWPMSIWFLTLIFCTLYEKQFRMLKYELSLFCSTSIILTLLCHVITVPELQNTHHPQTLFPEPQLTFATALMSFHIAYLNTLNKTFMKSCVGFLLLSTLCLTGFALIYININWVTSILASYSIGLCLFLFHWIFFRRYSTSPSNAKASSFLPIIALFFTTITVFYFQKPMPIQAVPTQYIISDGTWWNQEESLLPIYSTNRFGKRREFLNIQYVGSLKKLTLALQEDGWKLQPDSFFFSLLMRAGGNQHAQELPFMAQLYQNRKPNLVMLYHQQNLNLILRLWRSNYHLHHYQQPIWIGSITPTLKNMPFLPSNLQLVEPIAAFHAIQQALPHFRFHQIHLIHHYIDKTPEPSSPILLMIKDPDV